MIRIKTPLGLGDAVYCWPIVKYFAERDSVVLSTKYPEIFNNIKDVQIDNSQNIFDIRLHYNQKRSSKNGQYQDILDQCRLPAIPFTFSFRNKKVFDISRVKKKSGDKKICIVKNPHSNDMLKSKNDFSLSKFWCYAVMDQREQGKIFLCFSRQGRGNKKTARKC